LEREEQARILRAELEKQEDDLLNETLPKLSEEQMAKVRRIREKRALIIQQSRTKKSLGAPRLPMKFATDPNKNLTAFAEHLDSLGLDGRDVVSTIRSRSKSRVRTPDPAESRSVSRSRVGRKRTRDELESRGLSVSRSVSMSIKDPHKRTTAERLAKRARRELARDGRLGESDRHVFDVKPKHLYSGKRGIGSTDRR